jgi:bifunctional non-homologous end joining protein LigD
MMLGGRDVMAELLMARRGLPQSQVLATVAERIRESPELDASLPDLIAAVKAHGLEGLVARPRDSLYEPGQRSGAWMKMCVNRGQEFVIGGYTPRPNGFDAIIFGYYDDGKLMYAGRTRNGFTPASRAQLFHRFRGLTTDACPLQFARGDQRSMGAGPDGREDGGLPLAEAGVGCAVRVR